MKKMTLIVALALCPAIPVLAQQQATAIHQGHKDKLDSNANGIVERSEYEAFMAAAFTNLDKSKDGSLQSVEVSQILSSEQFSLIDSDRDGAVSQGEFMKRVMDDFGAADRSGDGNLQ